MELRHLRYFVAVAREGHVTRAAERLGLQQPPLSQQIKALEEELGVRLFHRRPRGVALTDVGVAFFDDAARILRDVDRAVARAQRTARGEEGRVAVGITTSAPFHNLVQRALRCFRDEWPAVAIELRESGSADLLDALEEGLLDLAFVRSALPKGSGVILQDLTVEPMLAAIPSSHRLARPEDAPLDLQDLAAEPFVLCRRPSGAGLYDAILAACSLAGFTPRIEQEAPWVGASLSLVAAGMGISIVPESFVRMHFEGVAYRRFSDEQTIAAPLRLARRKSDLSAAALAFAARVRTEAKILASDADPARKGGELTPGL